MIRILEKAGIKILRFLAAVSFVDAVYLFNTGDMRGAAMFGIASLLLWAVTKDGYLI